VDEKRTSAKTVRPTKKQKELLGFIEAFIDEHGYSPSYREIMTGLNYTSVATVALHVNNLIKRGHLQKRDHSARSLETVRTSDNMPAASPQKITSNQIKPGEEKWLVEKIEHAFRQAESGTPDAGALDDLGILVGALKVLGMEGASQSFVPRLTELRRRAGAGGN
jgi:SOS-response transcriptional repressor LexA